MVGVGGCGGFSGDSDPSLPTRPPSAPPPHIIAHFFLPSSNHPTTSFLDVIANIFLDLARPTEQNHANYRNDRKRQIFQKMLKMLHLNICATLYCRKVMFFSLSPCHSLTAAKQDDPKLVLHQTFFSFKYFR